jgi:peptide/nickel transport system ATP-binding protein
MSTGNEILRLDDIHVIHTARTGTLFRRDKVHAVNAVSLTLNRGETIGIVGESGCGKSTLARVMVGLQEPTSGTVSFKGRNIVKRDRATAKAYGKAVSIIFQDPSTALNARMSVHDVLMDPLRVHGIGTLAQREARVRELLDLVGLPASTSDVFPGQVSGGQRQRVAIARALALEPDIIIADEPTSALDVSVRAQILNLLSDLKVGLNLGMAFISHDIQTVRYVSDRIVVMKTGRVVEEGPAEQVFTTPTDPYTRTLLGAAPSLLIHN